MRYERLQTRSLLQILIQSMVLFQIGSSIHLIITSYPELELDFAEFRTEQDKKEIPDSSAEDVMSDLQQTCVYMRYAKTYKLLTWDKTESKKTFPTDYSQCRNLSDSLIVRDLLVKMGDEFEDRVSMFLCCKDPKFGYIYLTPGFGNEFKFLFSQADHQTYPMVYGLVEPIPFVNDAFLDQRHLEKFFVQAHRMYDSKPRSELSLSILNINQQHRLCSLVEEARNRYKQQVAEEKEENLNEEQKKEKEAKLIEERMNRRVPLLEQSFDITFLQLDKRNPVYAHLDVVISMLPCFIHDTELIFLLSEDPLDASAVFVFERNIDQKKKKRREISIVQHVSDIAFLKNMDKFY